MLSVDDRYVIETFANTFSKSNSWIVKSLLDVEHQYPALKNWEPKLFDWDIMPPISSYLLSFIIVRLLSQSLRQLISCS